MCGIIGRVAPTDGVDELLTGLENLEYRGYDSAGLAVQNGHGIAVEKREGEIDALRSAVERRSFSGDVGIGHTRWSTHGEPVRENAHPHTDCTGRVAVVHNGIIENHDELREALAKAGHEFESETDTETIPHLLEARLEEGLEPEAAFRDVLGDVEGSYAIAAIVEGIDAVFAARHGSPLVLGRARDRHYLASDVPAFLEFTDTVTYLEDGDVAVLSPEEVTITDLEGTEVSRSAETVDWDHDEVSKGTYDHFMQKEIHAQPEALEQTVRGRVDGDRVDLEEFPPGWFEGTERVHLVACGTSYHAAMYGAQLLTQAGVDARPFRASEYASRQPPVADGTLAIAVTQSGETADTLSAIEHAGERGARTVAVTNVVGSSVTREVDETLLIRAGPEIGVAATKTFSSQAVALTLLAQRLAADVPAASTYDNIETLLSAVSELPRQVEAVLEESRAEHVARRYASGDAFFFIGRGFAHPVALEGALKFKEITYEHAEGFASGELKHGPLALVTPETPVFAVFTGDEDEKTRKNAEEARARGADIVTVGPPTAGVHGIGDDHLSVPDTHPALAGLLANVQLQLLSYESAALLGRSIDKPRNLAKSVTVE